MKIKDQALLWAVLSIFWVSFFINNVDASALSDGELRAVNQPADLLLQTTPEDTTVGRETPAPTDVPPPTPTPRPEMQVGTNAGLVCGASVLVLIVIGGVVWSSRRRLKAT